MDRSIIDELLRQATDKGKLIELEWLSFVKAVMPPNASDVQISEMRKAFFAGAQHLFGSIMSILEPDAEPTEKDLERMTLIDIELKEFVKQLRESVFS